MTREQSNERKHKLIELIKARRFNDPMTISLMRIFLQNNKYVDKLHRINRSLEAYPIEEAQAAQKEALEYIMANIEKWITIK